MEKSVFFEIDFHPHCVFSFFVFIYMYAQSTNNDLLLCRVVSSRVETS